MSRRTAPRRFGMTESAAVKRLQLHEATGERRPAGTGGHRASKLKPHCDFVVAVLKEKPAITLVVQGQRPWAERGAKAHTGMLGGFLRGYGMTRKKDAGGTQAGSPGRKPAPGPTAQISKPDRPRPARVHRRDLGQGQYDVQSWLGRPRQAARRQNTTWPLEHD